MNPRLDWNLLLVATRSRAIWTRLWPHFEDALTFCRKAGYRPELPWTCCDYAGALRERDEDGDRPKAFSLLDESLAISASWGCGP